jgi:nucleoside-diphosphate-sugar epimerase
MTKVLVTGGAGFIGSHLCDRLVHEGHDVVVLDDLSSGSFRNIAHLENRITFIHDSVLNLRAHTDTLEGVRRIYHLAALISGYDSLHRPDEYLDINLHGLLRIIEYGQRAPRTRIIFASSSTIYGNRPGQLCRESDHATPMTVYALSKYAGEHLLSIYSSMYGFDFVCLRLFNVYGPRQSTDHPYANVTCKFSAAAAYGEPIQLCGDGEQSRDFVFVEDVVRAFLLVSEESRERIYNVGTGLETKIVHLITELESLTGNRLTVTKVPPWPNDIRSIGADVTRLGMEFGFRPSVHVSEGLRRTVDWFRAQRQQVEHARIACQ